MKNILTICFLLILLTSCSSISSHYNNVLELSNINDVKSFETEINILDSKLLKNNSLVYADYGFLELRYESDIPYRITRDFALKKVSFEIFGIKNSTFPIKQNLRNAFSSFNNIKLFGYNKNILRANYLWDEDKQEITINENNLLNYIDFTELVDKINIIPIISKLSYSNLFAHGAFTNVDEYKIDFYIINNKEILYKKSFIYWCEGKNLKTNLDQKTLNQLLKTVLDEIYK